MKIAKIIGRRNKSSADRYFFAISVCLCIVSLAVLGFAYSLSLSTTNKQAEFVGLKTGSSVTHGSARVSISSVHSEKGSGRYTAPDGKHYVVLTLTVDNLIDTPIIITPSSDTYMKNAAGNVVYLTPLELSNPFRSGILLPGETVRGELSYLVNDGVDYKYYIESDWSGGAVSFLLQ